MLSKFIDFRQFSQTGVCTGSILPGPVQGGGVFDAHKGQTPRDVMQPASGGKLLHRKRETEREMIGRESSP
jgi:hypothetical protein